MVPLHRYHRHSTYYIPWVLDFANFPMRHRQRPRCHFWVIILFPWRGIECSRGRRRRLLWLRLWASTCQAQLACVPVDNHAKQIIPHAEKFPLWCAIICTQAAVRASDLWWNDLINLWDSLSDAKLSRSFQGYAAKCAKFPVLRACACVQMCISCMYNYVRVSTGLRTMHARQQKKVALFLSCGVCV